MITIFTINNIEALLSLSALPLLSSLMKMSVSYSISEIILHFIGNRNSHIRLIKNLGRLKLKLSDSELGVIYLHTHTHTQKKKIRVHRILRSILASGSRKVRGTLAQI